MIVEAAKRMRTSHVGALVVVETRDRRHVPVGILTDRDIVISVVASDPEHIMHLLVSDVMSDSVVTAREPESIDTALERMKEHGVRRLPVVGQDGSIARNPHAGRRPPLHRRTATALPDERRAALRRRPPPHAR